MDRKAMLLKALDRSAEIERQFVRDLTPTERNQIGAVNRWSAKDLLSHVTAWQQHLVQGLDAERGWFSTQTVEDIDHTNAQIFEAYKNLTWDEVISCAGQARGAMRARVARSTPSELSAPVGTAGSNDQPLWRRLVGNAVIHAIMHYAQFYDGRGEKPRAVAIQEEMGEMLLALDDDPAWQGVTRYNMACAYALAGLSQQAIRALGRALELNPGLREWATHDSDLDSLRDDPAYKALYAS